jgi:DNA-binding transcriptional MerR regulator
MSPRARVQKRLYYKIGEACKALGIQPYVLRYWETEFPALSPSKSRSGQRVYSEKELEVIRRIKELLYDEGYTIAGAKKKLEGELLNGTGGEAVVMPSDEGRLQSALPLDRVLLDNPSAAAVEDEVAAPDVEPAPRLDTRGVKQIETLRTGIKEALREARELLALLDANSS